jgi:multidrug efflux pump subunit AcrA (membrane-fusion protein)
MFTSLTRHPRCGRALPLLLVAVLTTGCDTHDHDHAQAHEEEEPRTDALTVHGGRHELFIEHRLLVANVTARFITHVTDEVTGEARREGPITYVLQRGNELPIEVPVPQIARLGIYLPELTFPKPGVWTVTVRIPWAEGVNDVVLPDRTVFASGEEAKNSPELEGPEGISFLKEQAWKVPVRVERATRRSLVERVRLPAEVQALPARQAFVTPPLAGTLRGAIPEPGDRIEANQIVGWIVPPLAGADLLAWVTNRQQLATQEADARARAERAAVVLAQARRTHQRVRELAAESARSLREVEEAESAERIAAAEEAAATRLATLIAELRQTLTAGPGGGDPTQGLPAVALRAPLSGTVSSVSAAQGEHVTPERALLRIVDTSLVEVEARLPEALVSRLGAGRSAWTEAPGAQGELVALTGEGVGRFLYVGVEVDEATRTVPLVWEVQNPQGTFRPGQSLDAHVETRNAPEVVAIPTAALVAEDARWVVFVQLGGETFERRDVTLGVRDGEWVEVRSGLAEGEWVVTHGGLTIRLASVSNVIPAHGHAH